MSLCRFPIAIAALLLCAPLIACSPPLFDGASQSVVGSNEAESGEKPVRLAVREAGSGKPMLLIHGLGASSYTWHAIIPELAKTRRVIALDLKGFGNSDKPLDDAYSIADQAKLVRDYIRRRDLRDLTVVGHSFGGAVALAVALEDAEQTNARISKLVLIDSVAYRQPIPLFFRILSTPVLGALSMSLVPPEVQTSRALAMAYHHDWKVSPETVANYAGPLYSEGGRHALARTIDSLINQDAEGFAARYRTLKTPALLIWCAHDRIVPLRFGKRLYRDLPRAEIDVIEECGHIPQEEQPGETIQAIRKFVGN